MKLDGIQPVWDNTFIDEEKTTASFHICAPQKKEKVFLADKPQDKHFNNYVCVLKDDDRYRMYYQGNVKFCWPPVEGFSLEREIMTGPAKGLKSVSWTNVNILYAESKDGVHWEKPNLGICEWKGDKNNNIICKSEDLKMLAFYDSFYVFKDENPACPPDKKYKAITNCVVNLAWLSSPDGIHFKEEGLIHMDGGDYDSMDLCWYDQEKKKYIMYIRGSHSIGTPMTAEAILADEVDPMSDAKIRDIRRAESEDFVHWTTPIPLTYKDATEDYQLYTNGIMPYYRNPNILVGFPVRYTQREEWFENYDELCGKEARRERMKIGKRMGLAVTDGLFMHSRDGYHFTRYDESFYSNEMECENNWRYGDGYWAYHMLETVSEEGHREISMFMPTKENEKDSFITRYTLRLDGFACYEGKAKGAKVVTKPLVFEGKQMHINFQTSAYGHLYVTIEDKDGNSITSCETFGNSNNRKLNFTSEQLAMFEGKEVVITFAMKDAKLYSFHFEK